MRRLLTTTMALLALAATAVAPLLLAAPADAAETIAIKPASLPRGPDIAGPHVDGTTIVDGDVSVKVKRPNVLLYGKWHDQFVAATGNSAWDNVKLVRISATDLDVSLRCGCAAEVKAEGSITLAATAFTGLTVRTVVLADAATGGSPLRAFRPTRPT